MLCQNGFWLTEVVPNSLIVLISLPHADLSPKTFTIDLFLNNIPVRKNSRNTLEAENRYISEKKHSLKSIPATTSGIPFHVNCRFDPLGLRFGLHDTSISCNRMCCSESGEKMNGMSHYP